MGFKQPYVHVMAHDIFLSKFNSSMANLTSILGRLSVNEHVAKYSHLETQENWNVGL